MNSKGPLKEFQALSRQQQAGMLNAAMYWARFRWLKLARKQNKTRRDHRLMDELWARYQQVQREIDRFNDA